VDAAVRSELAAWGDAAGPLAITELAREYAAARGLSVPGSGSGSVSGSGDEDGGDGGERKKNVASPLKKSSPSSEAKETMEQKGGDANPICPPRKARRRRHGSKERDGDDEGEAAAAAAAAAGEGSGGGSGDSSGGGSGAGDGEHRAKSAASSNRYSSIAAGHARVRELLSFALQGRAAEVEAAVEAAKPGFLRSRPAAAFDLRAARLRHLAAGEGGARAALAEARAALSPLADACPGLLLPRLKETMAGLLPVGGGGGGAAGAGGGRGGGGGGAGAALAAPRPPPQLGELRLALLEALAVPEPRLGVLLGDLLRVHEAWFAAQRCRDALEGAAGLAALRAPGWDPWASLPPRRAAAAAGAAAAGAFAPVGAGPSRGESARARGDRAAPMTALDWTNSAGWHAIAGVRGQALVLGTAGGGGPASRGFGAGAAGPGAPSPPLPVERGDGGEDESELFHDDDDDDEGDEDDDGGGRRNNTGSAPATTNDDRYDDGLTSNDDDYAHSSDEEREEEQAARAAAQARAALRSAPPDEDVVMVMEFTGMGRAAALDLLARHGGSPQAAVQSLYS